MSYETFKLIIQEFKDKVIIKTKGGQKTNIIAEIYELKDSVIRIFKSIKIYGTLNVNSLKIKDRDIFDENGNLFLDKISNIGSEYNSLLIRNNSGWSSGKLIDNIYIDVENKVNDIEKDIDIKFYIPKNIHKNFFKVTFYITMSEDCFDMFNEHLCSFKYRIESFNNGEVYTECNENKLLNDINYEYKNYIKLMLTEKDKNKVFITTQQIVNINSSTNNIAGTLGILKIRKHMLNDDINSIFINKGKIIGAILEYENNLNST